MTTLPVELCNLETTAIPVESRKTGPQESEVLKFGTN